MKPNLPMCILLGLVVGLPGCNNPMLKKEDSIPDALEIERLAEQAYENQDWPASEEYYADLVKRIPQIANHWFRLGNVYARTQRPDNAVFAYREALLRDPEMAKAWFNMGVLQLRQAANSFDELQRYGDKEDPLYTKGRKIFTGIIELITGDESKQE